MLLSEKCASGMKRKRNGEWCRILNLNKRSQTWCTSDKLWLLTTPRPATHLVFWMTHRNISQKKISPAERKFSDGHLVFCERKMKENCWNFPRVNSIKIQLGWCCHATHKFSVLTDHLIGFWTEILRHKFLRHWSVFHLYFLSNVSFILIMLLPRKR